MNLKAIIIPLGPYIDRHHVQQQQRQQQPKRMCRRREVHISVTDFCVVGLMNYLHVSESSTQPIDKAFLCFRDEIGER